MTMLDRTELGTEPSNLRKIELSQPGLTLEFKGNRRKYSFTQRIANL